MLCNTSKEKVININKSNIDKSRIIVEITSQLKQELAQTLEAANNAHKAATDDQSVAETQYDTLAIEQSYLAEGQSRRVDEIRYAIKLFENFQFDAVTEHAKVGMGSLVQMEQDFAQQQWFFIAPAAGGYRCQTTVEHALANITVITRQSPLGAALLNKVVDEEVNIVVGAKNITDFIVNIK